MKLIQLLITALSLSLILSSSIKSTQYTVLPQTPKGYQLDNIYGEDPIKSPIGPETILNHVIMNVISPEGRIETIQVNKSLLNHPLPNLCDLENRPAMKLCYTLECDMCVASPHCGWCASTNKCVPGNGRGVECPNDCLTNWIFNENKHCRNTVKSGSLSNIAKEANHMINATLATPKLAISISNPDTIDHTLKIKYGVQKTSSDLTMTDSQGNIHNVQKSTVTPLVGEIHDQIPILDHVETKYIDLINGKEINQTANTSLWGIESVNHTNKTHNNLANETVIDGQHPNTVNPTTPVINQNNSTTTPVVVPENTAIFKQQDGKGKTINEKPRFLGNNDVEDEEEDSD